jgi:hypothetical protein
MKPMIMIACAAILSFEALGTIPGIAATEEAIRVGNLITRYQFECQVPIGDLAVRRLRHWRHPHDEDWGPQADGQDATYRVKRTAACERLRMELKKLGNCPVRDDYGSWNPDC